MSPEASKSAGYTCKGSWSAEACTHSHGLQVDSQRLKDCILTHHVRGCAFPDGRLSRERVSAPFGVMQL